MEGFVGHHHLLPTTHQAPSPCLRFRHWEEASSTSIALDFDDVRGDDPSRTPVSLDFDTRRSEDPSTFHIARDIDTRKGTDPSSTPVPLDFDAGGGRPILYLRCLRFGCSRRKGDPSSASVASDFDARRRDGSSIFVATITVHPPFDTTTPSPLLEIIILQSGSKNGCSVAGLNILSMCWMVQTPDAKPTRSKPEVSRIEK
jgi:hypothetical protein